MTSTGQPLSGEQVVLTHGDAEVAIASIGASLRSYTVAGRDLVVPFAAEHPRTYFRGAVLAPWPNRIVDGRYTFGGVAQQLPLTEPDRHHAIHGLVGWADFEVEDASERDVTLSTTVVAQQGYPYRLDVQVGYALTDDGLVTTITATNTGDAAAPYGASIHPYLSAGPGRVDDWTLEVAAAQVLEVDADRLIPQGLTATAGGPFDFAVPRPIGELFIDHAFTGFGDGRATLRLIAGDGQGVSMSWDAANAPWLQIHTADRPEPDAHRAGLAVEPMTCPPDAFNSGTDLVVLEPGDEHRFATVIARAGHA